MVVGQKGEASVLRSGLNEPRKSINSKLISPPPKEKNHLDQSGSILECVIFIGSLRSALRDKEEREQGCRDVCITWMTFLLARRLLVSREGIMFTERDGALCFDFARQDHSL